MNQQAIPAGQLGVNDSGVPRLVTDKSCKTENEQADSPCWTTKCRKCLNVPHKSFSMQAETGLSSQIPDPSGYSSGSSPQEVEIVTSG